MRAPRGEPSAKRDLHGPLLEKAIGGLFEARHHELGLDKAGSDDVGGDAGQNRGNSATDLATSAARFSTYWAELFDSLQPVYITAAR